MNDKQYFERFSLIWLDSNSQHTRDIEQKLKSLIHHFIKFQDLQQCQQYIQQTSSKDRFILMTDDQLGRQLIPSIHHLQQVTSIYIYHTDRKLNEQDFSKYSKIKDGFANVDELFPKIIYHHRIRRQIEEPFKINTFSLDGKSTVELNGRFVFFQVLIHFILKLKSTDEDKNELITLYENEYQGNIKELNNLKEFRTYYSTENTLWWYTRESFFYRTINSALRSEDIHRIFLLRSFIFDIQQQLQKHQCNEPLTVFRSQIMSTNELTILKKSIHQLISINSFFSTSKDRSSAIFMLGEANDNVDWERILFEINTDPKMIKTKPFADISQLSYFPNEFEILFMAGSIFRVDNILNDENHFSTVQMTLCNNNEYDFTNILKDMKQQIENEQINLRTLGKILWNMGKLELAEQYFLRLLSQLTSDDLLVGDLFEDLTKLTSQMKNYDQSLKWYEKLSKFKEDHPFISSIKSLENSIRISNNDLELFEEIGQGSFGTVYRAKWLKNENIVAVKQLHTTHLSKKAEQIFFNESSLLNRVRDPNIVTLYGVCLEKERYALIIEYMPLGSLYDLLYEKKIELSWSHRNSIALQSTKGINYLHQYQPQILHRDIKSLNILLEKQYDGYLVKVCDFGMAKIRNETTRQATTTGNIDINYTLSWAAPEVLRLRTYTDKSDIYSLGIVYWELASHLIPYYGYDYGVIREFVLAGDRLDIPTKTPSNFQIAIKSCWAQEPENRPTCLDLFNMFNQSIISGILNKQKSNIKWKQNGVIVAGGSQLFHPRGIYIDDQQQAVYIADQHNNRIIKWRFGADNGQIVAGGNGKGNRIDQLFHPTDVIVDYDTKSLIICDRGNTRLVRWSIENQFEPEIIVSAINCYGLMMNKNGDLFVSDFEKSEVRRWKKGEEEGTIVAGGNGTGSQLNQFNGPTHIFIDHNDTIYVSDEGNHRVMKWTKDAKEGIVVAGRQRSGNGLKELSYPAGVVATDNGDVYVADCGNHRIMCWPSGSQIGHIIFGGNDYGQESNQLNGPNGLSFDSEKNLYVAEYWNDRIQRINVDKDDN